MNFHAVILMMISPSIYMRYITVTAHMKAFCTHIRMLHPVSTAEVLKNLERKVEYVELFIAEPCMGF